MMTMDGIPDLVDNCSHEPNNDQLDSNNDGKGKSCGDVHCIKMVHMVPLPWQL